MPDSYDWLSHTTSESAAQGLSGAWLARLGFLTLGLGVLWLSSLTGRRWGRWGQLSHRMFGVMMLATAAFSHRPIEQDVVFDRTEDLLHSIAATAMGFAFAFGVVAVMLRRPERMLVQRVVDVTALATSIIIPLSMNSRSGSAGLLQRTMFLIAYLWYATEAWGTLRRTNAGS
jgi:thiol:disulfide interchange protein